MQRYGQYARQYGSASPAGGATIEVFNGGTLTYATIYADNATPTPTAKANFFYADADGYFFFYAAPGRYDVRISGAGVTSPYTWADILLIDDSDVAYTDRANTFVGNQAVTGNLAVTGSGTFGTPAVPLIGADGRLTALTASYLANLSGAALTGLNASEVTVGTLPDARLSGSYTQTLTLSNVANVLAGARLGLGTLPATTGAVRLTFGEGLYSRNQANSGDVAVLRLSTDDYAILTNASAQHLRPFTDDTYNFGEDGRRWRNGHIKDLYLTGLLTLGDPTDAASAGAFRLPNGTAWMLAWRNAAGNADLGGLWAGADDKFYLGFAAVVTNDLEPDSDNDEDIGTTSARYRTGRFGTSVALGTNPAASGLLRLANAGKVVGRNAANNADIDLFALDAADYFRVYRKTRYDGPQSTGGGSAALGTNCPAVTASAPYTWFEVMTADGSVGFIPVWK